MEPLESLAIAVFALFAAPVLALGLAVAVQRTSASFREWCLDRKHYATVAYLRYTRPMPAPGGYFQKRRK